MSSKKNEFVFLWISIPERDSRVIKPTRDNVFIAVSEGLEMNGLFFESIWNTYVEKSNKFLFGLILCSA